MSADLRSLFQSGLLDPGFRVADLLAQQPPIDPVALAWVIKQACYEAWNSEPQQARRCADLLGELAAIAPDGVIAALAAWTAGIAALAQGDMADALLQLDRAFDGFMALRLEGPAAETRVPKIAVLAMLGRESEAHAEAETSRRMFLATGDLRSAGKVELNLGVMLARQDRHEEAAALFRAAGQRFARLRDDTQSIFADIGLANALTWTFELEEARFVAERARVRAELRGYKVLAAHAHAATGRIELHCGQHAPALRALALASALFKEAGASPLQRIEADTALAEAYASVGLLPEALSVFRDVVAQSRAASAQVEQARGLVGEAAALARMGASADALLPLTQARSLFESFGNATSAAYVDLCLGQCLLEVQRHPEAGECADRARALLEQGPIAGWRLEARLLSAAVAERGGQPDAARALCESVVEEAGPLSQIERRARVALAALELKALQLPAARRHLGQVLDLIDQQRAALPHDEFRAAIGAESELAGDLLVATTLADPEAGPAAVLRSVERGRARAMVHLVSVAVDRAAADRRGSAELGLLRERATEAVVDGDAARAARFMDRSRRLEADLLEQHRRALLLRGGVGSPDTEGVLAEHGLEALQHALGSGGALVEYHLGPHQAVACVVTAQAVHTVALEVSALDRLLEGLRFQMEALSFGAASLRSHELQLLSRCKSHLQRLHELLWRPLAALVGSRERVVVVPHKVLHYVPFCALHDGALWLVQRHAITLAPSAAVWLNLQGRRERQPRRVLAVGHGGAHLPQVDTELAALAQHFGADARLLRGAEATRKALRELAPDADVLHMACHGSFRADNPAFSSLQLADGPFTVTEAAQLDLRAALVVLSACETANSRVAPGDELLGLVRGFTRAGASSVLASQWSVDDASTANLMAAMYAELRNGSGPARSLQSAQSALAAADRHPFYWAAFGLYGRG
jgi:CHAT domain-containing protein/tetratricopeptide (TPR) repeat protein